MNYCIYNKYKNRLFLAKEVEIKTPIAVSKTTMIDGDIVIVPILRAGLGMVEGIQRLIPQAKVGHIGLFRNEETLEPVKYFYKVPKGLNKKQVILLKDYLFSALISSISFWKL